MMYLKLASTNWYKTLSPSFQQNIYFHNWFTWIVKEKENSRWEKKWYGVKQASKHTVYMVLHCNIEWISWCIHMFRLLPMLSTLSLSMSPGHIFFSYEKLSLISIYRTTRHYAGVPRQILDTISDTIWLKWATQSISISDSNICLWCEISMRNQFSQTKSKIVYALIYFHIYEFELYNLGEYI